MNDEIKSIHDTINQAPLKVEVTRGVTVESQHLVDAVVMSSDKQIISAFGDIHDAIFPRSAIKMLQALLLVESGAYHALNLDLRHLSLASSSHYADPVHTELVHEWLAKLDLTEDNLRCGAQTPSRDSVRDALILNHKKPNRGHNNCSGKHSGLLSVCRHKNYDVKNYDKYDHPVQQDLIRLLSEVYEFDLARSPYGVDGCGIPTIAVPLYNLTLGHINLTKRKSGQMILEGIAKFPELISGENNLCTEIVRITNGKVFAKVGAEGVYTAFCPSKDVFISLKVLDGASRAAQFSVVHLLKLFGCFTSEEADKLHDFLNPTLKNWEGFLVGEVRMYAP